MVLRGNGMQELETTETRLPMALRRRIFAMILPAGSVPALVLMALGPLSLGATEALAHGGRLASDGCHMDRSTGVRHCHRGPNAVQPQQQRDGSPYYLNCAAARAAGVTPILRGQPGYGRHLDRDGDGVACE